MGRRGVRARPRRGPADLSLDRLLRVPLVPRDGARVVREPGDRGADERALRERQGRPGGATGRRRALHGGRDRAQPQRRLAAQPLPHARGEAVLGRDVPPAGAAARDAELSGHPRGGRGRVARQSRGAAEVGRLADRAPAEGCRLRPSRAERRRRPDDAGDREPHLQLRLGVGRVGAGAEVPAGAGARVPDAPRRAADAGEDARRDGGRGHVRPGRGRVPPLLRRPEVARAPLREDAVRQRAAGGQLSPRLADDRQGAVPDDRRADAAVHAPGARARGRRLRLLAGRGHERARGADVHVGPPRGRYSGRAAALVRGRAVHPARAARRDEAAAALRAARAAAEARTRRQGGRLLERADARRTGGVRPGARRRGVDRRGARARGVPARAVLDARRGGSSAHGATASRREPATWRTTPTWRTG